VVEKKAEDAKTQKGKMITNENDENILVNFDLYRRYFGAYYGPLFFFTLLASMGVAISARISNDYLLGKWVSSED
jgi:hypothetical protein